MPYTVRKVDGKYCVFKKDGGKKVGCTKGTETAKKKYLAALHSNTEDEEKKKGIDGKACWKGYRLAGTKKKGGKTVDNCVKVESFKEYFNENYADGKVKGKSRPGRVKRSGASCKGSVTELRKKAKKYGGEKGKMYHWCANMKGGKKKKE